MESEESSRKNFFKDFDHILSLTPPRSSSLPIPPNLMFSLALSQNKTGNENQTTKKNQQGKKNTKTKWKSPPPTHSLNGVSFVLANYSCARLRVCLTYQVHSIAENWFSLSPYLSISNSFLVGFLGLERCAHLPFSVWTCTSSMCSVSLWVHMCLSSIVSGRHCFLGIIYYLWLL